MKGTHSDILRKMLQYSKNPPLFEPGEPRFWDDPHISKGMLEAHLNPTHDAASRRPETIDKEVRHLITSGTLKTGDRLLDLGCGPGLYAIRFAAKSIKVTGIDISKRSIDYARKSAKENGLKIDYRLMNFFDIKYEDEYDAVAARTPARPTSAAKPSIPKRSSRTSRRTFTTFIPASSG